MPKQVMVMKFRGVSWAAAIAGALIPSAQVFASEFEVIGLHEAKFHVERCIEYGEAELTCDVVDGSPGPAIRIHLRGGAGMFTGAWSRSLRRNGVRFRAEIAVSKRVENGHASYRTTVSLAEAGSRHAPVMTDFLSGLHPRRLSTFELRGPTRVVEEGSRNILLTPVLRVAPSL